MLSKPSTPTAIRILVSISLLLGISTIAALNYQSYRNEQLRKAQELANAKKPDVAITIIEGWRREQIAVKLEELGICPADAFMTASKGKEGMLFPDTYRFFTNTPAEEVVRTLTTNFSTRTAGNTPSAEQLILASIVEREAKTSDERPLIAGVYQNRLTIGMKLDADPTVQYGRDQNLIESGISYKKVSYWKPITRSDYKGVLSPYNTYISETLPPSPIANPGLASIKAAMNPSSHDYYYFLHRDGRIFLSKTLSEHESKQ